MPLFYQQHINQSTRLAIWKIEESESFFSETVPLQRDITHPHKRLQHLAGRYLLRFLFPDFPYCEILIADTRKPYLANEAYHFSISHCGDFAAAIVSKNERVGIDMEIPSEKIYRIAHKFVNEEENVMLEVETANEQLTKDQPTNQQIHKLTILWCAKETMFKWYALGNVDFRAMLQVNIKNIEQAGTLEAFIKTPQQQIPLSISYHFLNPVCLTFTHTNPIIHK
jgi:phosphopantetheinyl transferase